MSDDMYRPDSPSEAADNGFPWASLALYALGVLTGILAFALFGLAGGRLPFGPAAANGDMRAAARDGTLDAIATLEARASLPPTPAATPTTVPAAAFALREANRQGDANAPVVMVEYSDFQCPYCGRYTREVQPEIVKQYVDTGKVQMAFKHYAFLGSESQVAAVASECAADQGKFWEYHDLLYNQQQGGNQGAFETEKLIALAEGLALDATEFEACLTERKTLDRVQADLAEGQQLGVRGTPAFFINGRPISGALPFAQFQQVIEQALAEAQ